VNDPFAGREWSRLQIGPRTLADSHDPITPARSKGKFQLATQLVRRLNQTVPGYDDRLYACKTGGKSGEDSCSCIMAMHYVGSSAPKRPVQGAHQEKKRATIVENNFKTFGS
jgi:hypothetical protein